MNKQPHQDIVQSGSTHALGACNKGSNPFILIIKQLYPTHHAYIHSKYNVLIKEKIDIYIKSWS